MIFTLRPYQQEAVDATLNHFRRHKTPAVIVLPTGAGKSLVIAELARLARGRVLVLAHVKELVAQNHAKYQALGLEADIFAAGLKRKESHGKVVFGSVQSVARNLDAFQGEFSLLIVDECHRIGDDEPVSANPHSPDKSESPLTPAGADCHAFSIGQRLDLPVSLSRHGTRR